MPSSGRILLVDPEARLRQGLARALAVGPAAPEVHAATSCAIAAARLANTPFNLVLVAHDLDGTAELFATIRRLCPAAQLLLMCGRARLQATAQAKAVLAGAAGVVQRPSPGDDLGGIAALLLRGLSDQRRAHTPGPTSLRARPTAGRRPELVAVGASTGGPPVLAQFLAGLPASFDLPIVVSQHMLAGHLPNFAESLGRRSGRRVELAAHGMELAARTTYVAAGDRHLLVARGARGLQLRLGEGPAEHFCRPAVDPMFRAVAAACGAAAIGVVMTGMGVDGAAGAQILRRSGAPVVVQDEPSSTVWGMPGAVVSAGAASEVVPAGELSKAVVRWAASMAGHDGRGRPSPPETRR